MTDIRMVMGGGTRAKWAIDEKVAILCSYVYLQAYKDVIVSKKYRDWVLDSGAFSAFNKGTSVSIEKYIDKCRELLDSDHAPVEIYALDVIGDWRGSLRNTEIMWRAGIEAIPCFHVDEPDDYLVGIARDYPKIALGGVALTRDKAMKLKWAEQCFARVWPKKVHGFGFGGERGILSFPWHSVDASTWILGPTAYGLWQSLGKGRLGLPVGKARGKQNVRSQVDMYLEMEEKARFKWRNELAELESQPSQMPAMTMLPQ